MKSEPDRRNLHGTGSPGGIVFRNLSPDRVRAPWSERHGMQILAGEKAIAAVSLHTAGRR